MVLAPRAGFDRVGESCGTAGAGPPVSLRWTGTGNIVSMPARNVMFRKCPHCGSLDVRRSSVRVAEVSLGHIFLSPYRCRSCRKLFWKVGRRVWHLVIVVGIAAVAGAIAFALFGEPGDRRAAPEAVPLDVARVEATTKLAQQNDPAAAYELSRMHAAGQGVPRSEKDRLAWLERAAEHGQADAQFELGIALREGRGLIQDYEKAAAWLQRSAASGNGYAQFELGRMYRSGTGLEVDNVKAYIWLNLAAAQGIAGADIARDSVLRQLTPAEIGEAQAEARRLAAEQRKRSPAPAEKP
jgi:uncharacterized protein